MTTRSADVVIIGGGVTGTSTAFHLTRRGVRDVVVVDKGAIASGGTGKSSACVRQHYSTAETCRMILYSLDFFQHFAERVDGQSCGFRHTGYLLGVDDKMRAPMEASVALQRSVGIDTRLVSPIEMRELEPRLRSDDLVAGCYEPASGYCNPVETAQGFARAARAGGARILEDSAVVGLLLDGDRVRGVRTVGGDIQAPVVLDAAGLWSAPVAAMAGVDLPIHVCRHKISIVSWPEADRRPHPMVYDFVTNIYTRPELGEHILVGVLDADEYRHAVHPAAYQEGGSLDESTEPPAP